MHNNLTKPNQILPINLKTKLQPALIFLGMYVVALGAGGIKPNCSTMGADQFDLSIPQDKEESKKFFSYFYWAINLGSLVSYTLITYICQYGIAGLGGVEYGFFDGYLIPTVMLSIGIAIFVIGAKKYKITKPEGSVINTVAAAVYEAAITRRNESSASMQEPLLHGEEDKKEGSSSSSSVGGAGGNNSDDKRGGQEHWLDRASSRQGGSFPPAFVESIKYLTRLVPFLLVMIPFWGIYGQTKTAFQLQACQMDVNLGDLTM
jgi:peptide/histidine transporter 3/4